MLAFESVSLAGRASAMLSDLQEQGRMSRAEAQTVLDIIWHPDLPDWFKARASAPQMTRQVHEATRQYAEGAV